MVFFIKILNLKVLFFYARDIETNLIIKHANAILENLSQINHFFSEFWIFFDLIFPWNSGIQKKKKIFLANTIACDEKCINKSSTEL